ncbi:MAG: DNA polymerase IV [Caulobacterales bacterium]
MNAPLTSLCRDCLRTSATAPERCPSCGGRRIISHAELATLRLAHVDCDAFFAAIEKRDDPSLMDKPVIVGGGKRGVVSTCCYIARLSGVRSAMPMFKALKLCPDAVVVKPNFAKYSEAGRAIREMMRDLTPLVEAASIDEAYLDLSGTELMHKAPPAAVLAGLQNRIEKELSLTISVGLSYCKFMAKLASELDKPRGFAVLGEKEAITFLADKPVRYLPGVGPAMANSLANEGIRTIGDITRAGHKKVLQRFGDYGQTLWARAHGEGSRTVDPDGERKSVSAETTFREDTADLKVLEDHLWTLAGRAAERAKEAGVCGAGVVLKLKDTQFRTITRRRILPSPTQMQTVLFEGALALLRAEATGKRYRLIGIGFADLLPASEADAGDLVDTSRPKKAAAERAADQARARFGDAAITRARDLAIEKKRES